MKVLAINPWIYDFAAYDFWLKPYGFLVILSYLKNAGVDVTYVDCLNKKTSRDSFGRGKIHSEIIDKPEVLVNIPRYFKRYGTTPAQLQEELAVQKPDYILITSSMTYFHLLLVETSAKPSPHNLVKTSQTSMRRLSSIGLNRTFLRIY